MSLSSIKAPGNNCYKSISPIIWFNQFEISRKGQYSVTWTNLVSVKDLDLSRETEVIIASLTYYGHFSLLRQDPSTNNIKSECGTEIPKRSV